jgi:hypothetical protein
LRVAAEKAIAQPKKPSPVCHQLSTTLAAWLLSDQKVLNPLPGTKLPSQPAGLFASATPCFRVQVRVTIFRKNSRIWSTGGLSLRPHYLKPLSELPQAFFEDALFISNPRREHFRDLILQRPKLIN